MNRLLCFLLLFTACTPKVSLENQLNRYNVVWTEPSGHPFGSMPLSGSAGFGANVWVEDGTVWLYMSGNNSYDENGNLLKLGAVKLDLLPNPFEQGGQFRQELDLYNGQILLDGKNRDGVSAQLSLWIDPQYRAIHIDAEGSEPLTVKAAFATWRVADSAAFSDTWLCEWDGTELTRADQVMPSDSAILWYHQNQYSVMGRMIRQQDFDAYADIVPDPTEDLIFGGLLWGTDMQFTGTEPVSQISWNGTQWNLTQTRAHKKQSLYILPFEMHSEHLERTLSEMISLRETVEARKPELRKQHESRWHDFWARSHIFINTDKGSEDTGFQVGRNYQLFRYMLATNQGGILPLKFNGGVFTVDPMQLADVTHIQNDTHYFFESTPDFRRWSNLFMAQNQRLLGWPTLASGDFDLTEPSLNFYVDRLEVAEKRSEHYWSHGGAAFPEHISLYGLPVGRLATKTGESLAKHLEYHFSMQLEFAYMALIRARYMEQPPTEYLPFVVSVVRFFDEHYTRENKLRTGEPYGPDGKLVIFPANVLEQYADATNPVEILTGLRTITEEVLRLPADVVPDSTRNYFTAFVDRVPDLDFEQRDGKTVISPARDYGRLFNDWEFAEMFTVFPYQRIHLGKTEGLEEAVATWRTLPESRSHAKEFWSWQCTPTYAAMIGEKADAVRLIIEKLSDKNANMRFPAFFGPGHDWIPDFNWGGSSMVALQRMLLISDDQAVELFPAWPRDWDVDFKLHGRDGLTVEARTRNGRIESLNLNRPVEQHNHYEQP